VRSNGRRALQEHSDHYPQHCQYYKNEGKTLEQVLALRPTEGYDERWGRTTGSWTTRDFVTAIYQTLPTKGPVFFTMQNGTAVPSTTMPSSGKVF